MTNILRTAYIELKGDSEGYWSDVSYTGVSNDVVSICTVAEKIKDSIVNECILKMPSDYVDLNPHFISLLIRCSLYRTGFLFTPLEALSVIEKHQDIFKSYKLLSTYVSLVSIRERISNCLLGNSYDRVVKEALAIVENKDIETGNLQDVCEAVFDYHELYKAAIDFYNSRQKEGYSRSAILKSISYELYLRLKFGAKIALFRSSSNFRYCKSDIGVRILYALTQRITEAYYEPLIYTRYDEGVAQGDSWLQNLAEADIYSKIVRIANIRRTTIIQDREYIVHEAMKQALQMLL